MHRAAQPPSRLAFALASLGLALALFGAAPASSAPDPAPTPAPAPAPKLSLETKDLDFGEVIHGQRTRLKVPVRNEGTAPLILKEVKPSCGCTVATFTPTIAPGARGEIELEFDSSERPPGYQSFRVLVYSNDAAQRDQGAYCTLLNLRGEVRTMFRLVPMGAFFGEFIHGLKPITKVVRVIGIDQAKGGFTLELTSKLPAYLKVEISPWEGPNGQRGQELRVTMDPSAPRGQVNELLELSTSVAIQPKLHMTVAALVNDRIVGPGLIDFGAFSRAEGSQRETLVERRDGQDGMPLAKVVSPYPWLEVQATVQDPRRLSLSLKVAPGAPSGAFAGSVKLLFDDPNQRLVEVPITGRIRSEVAPSPALILLPASAQAGEVVAEVVCERPLVGASLEPAECGLSATVRGQRVELRASGAALPVTPVTLVLQTEVAGEERVRVQVLPR